MYSKTAAKRLEKAHKELREAEKAYGPCGAVIWHGPGHQSKSRCTVIGPHQQHSIRNRGYYWHGMKAFSGYFNESPEEPR